MKVLIFGGNGLLGTELCKLFSGNGIAFDSVSRTGLNCKYHFDISHKPSFDALIVNQYDYVINCASMLPGGNFLDAEYLEKIYRSNLLGTQNICAWLEGQNSVKKLINCSTLVVNNKPWPVPLTESHCSMPIGHHILYAASKLMQEAIFETFSQIYKLPLVQLRFSALYGPKMRREGVLCNLIETAKKHNKIEITNGSKVFTDFLNVKDAARIVYSVLSPQEATGIVNAASGKETSLVELAKAVAAVLPTETVILNKNIVDFPALRASVSVEKLSQFINPNTFKKLSAGLKEMIDL